MNDDRVANTPPNIEQKKLKNPNNQETPIQPKGRPKDSNLEMAELRGPSGSTRQLFGTRAPSRSPPSVPRRHRHPEQEPEPEPEPQQRLLTIPRRFSLAAARQPPPPTLMEGAEGQAVGGW